MKKILLATTALTMSASFAAADLSMSGRAGAGAIGGATDGVWSGIDINISASVETDGDLSI